MKVKLLNVLSSSTKPKIKPKLFPQTCHIHSPYVPKWGTIDLHPQLGNWVIIEVFNYYSLCIMSHGQLEKMKIAHQSYWEFNNGGKNSNFLNFQCKR
jgi:hypothetical protein